MAFDPGKDKILKKWKCKDTGLVVSINQYADGQPKLQIEIIDEVRDELTRLAKPE
jgi:predicted metal-dependent peptidase